MSAAYFRRVYGNFIVTDNLLTGPSDYDPYCITAPTDARLPGGGGQRICGLYDLNPAKVGQIDQVRTYSDKYGDQYKHWNGIDINLNARLPNKILVQGGVSTGKTMTDNCNVVTKLDNPSTYNCHQETPFLTQTKFLAAYPLPWWDIQVSATYQRMVYDPTGTFTASALGVLGMRALYVATNAVIVPSLGRSLSGGAANATIDLIEAKPGLFFDPLNQVDFRVSKTFVVKGTRIQGLFDAYNLLNANTVLTLNTSYGTDGANWLRPTAALPGRLVRFGVQIKF